MPITPNFSLWSPDDSDDWDLTIDLAAMAISIDAAITSATTSLIGTDAQRIALASPQKKAGLRWFSSDTGREWVSTSSATGAWTPVSFSGVSVTTTTAQTTNAAFSPKVVTWNVKAFDTDNYHNSGTPSRLTAPVAGYYRVTAKIRTASTTQAGGLSLALNGVNDNTTRVVTQPSTSGAAFASVTRTLYLTAGQYVEMNSQAEAVMAITTAETFFEMVRVP